MTTIPMTTATVTYQGTLGTTAVLQVILHLEYHMTPINVDAVVLNGHLTLLMLPAQVKGLLFGTQCH